MTLVFNSFQALLVPFIVIFGLIGLRRGFWREVGITGGMALVLLGTVIFPTALINFINRIIINIPRVFGLLLNVDAEALPPDLIFGDPDSGRFLLARFALFVLLATLVYTSRYSWAYELGREGPRPRATRSAGQALLGGVFGAITGLLWFVALNSFLNQLRALRNDPIIPPEGTTLTIPTIEDLSPVVAFVPTLVAILLIILLVLAFLRLPNIWRGP
ncbi:MAG TPA: hypothetical protein VFZ66_28135 [Herpetosiphonaceae bacterium]